MKAKNIIHVSGSLDSAVLEDIAQNGVTVFDDTNKWKSKNFHGIIDSLGNLKIRETYRWSIQLNPLKVVKD